MYNDIGLYLDSLIDEGMDINEYLETWQETELIIKLEKLVKYIRFLDFQVDNCESEIARIKIIKEKNESKVENIKKYILNLIDDKPINVGTFRLSKRRSTSTELIPEKENLIPDEFIDTKITKTPNKTRIKDFLSKDLIDNETGEVKKNDVDWAYLKNNVSLIIK